MSQPSHHSEGWFQMQLPPRLGDLWESEMVPQLPKDLDEQARVLKALQRTREIDRASDLLRALLAWALGGYSFRQLGCWAVILGVADISEAAWRKRVRRCGDWLQWLLKRQMVPSSEAGWSQGRQDGPRVLLVDGTSLGQTGGSGDDWRVQLVYDLVEGRLVDVQIGDRQFAETLVGLPGRPGDVFLGDRAYGRRSNVLALDHLQAACLLRFSPNQCRLEQEGGRSLVVSQWLAGLEETVQIGECEGFCVEGEERARVRVLALRLPEEAAEQARARVRARAKRKKQAVRPETLQLAGWVLLLSTLPASDFSGAELFWLYRVRWHIELLIKQMKQFLLLVRLRSHHPETVRAALLAALLAWVLQEEEGQSLVRSLQAPSEAGHQGLLQAYLPLVEQWDTDEPQEQESASSPKPPISQWLVMATCTSRLRVLVLGQWSLARMQFCLPRLRRFFCPSPRRRLHLRLWFQAWAQRRLLGPEP